MVVIGQRLVDVADTETSGLLAIPDELPPRDPEAETSFVEELTEAMTAPVEVFTDVDGDLLATEPDGNVTEVFDPLIPSDTCDLCRAADLIARGVMTATVGPDELHAQCRTPGDCDCGCVYARGGRCHNCHRIRTRDQLTAAGECIDRENCAIAMLATADEPDPPKLPPTSRSGGKRPSRPPTTKAPRTPKAKTAPRPCSCGCGDDTAGGLYRPGHDARHVKNLVARVLGGDISAADAAATLPSDALRDKLRKQVDG